MRKFFLFAVLILALFAEGQLVASTPNMHRQVVAEQTGYTKLKTLGSRFDGVLEELKDWPKEHLQKLEQRQDLLDDFINQLKTRPDKLKEEVARLRERVNQVGNLDDLVDWANSNGLSHLTQAEIKGTFDLFEGNIGFAQKALLSSKEIVAGKTLPELVQHFNLPTIPSAQSLTPYQARVWYSWRKSQISTLVNRSNGLEAAAREAVEMRNTIRTTTRTSMKDVDIADFLNTKEVNKTFDVL